jgi:hypothetical protein
MQMEMHTERLFCFLEQLAISLLKEIYQNVYKANRDIKLPKQLTKRARILRQVRPVASVETPAARSRIPSVRQASLPSSSDSDADMQLGEQPI